MLVRSWFGHADAWLHVALTTLLLALVFGACRALAAAGHALWHSRRAARHPKRDTPTP